MLYTYIRKPCSHFSAGLVISLVHLLYSQITVLAFYILSTSIPQGFRQLPVLYYNYIINAISRKKYGLTKGEYPSYKNLYMNSEYALRIYYRASTSAACCSWRSVLNILYESSYIKIFELDTQRYIITIPHS